jgi:hypothetical protein
VAETPAAEPAPPAPPADAVPTDEAAAANQGIDNQIQNDQPPFYLNVDVNRPTRLYREGDALSIAVMSEKDAYLYVEYQQADGKVFQIFPNKLQPNGRVAAKQPVLVPGPDDRFRWKIGPPYGREVVKVIASLEPLENLSRAELRSERFNPVSAQVVSNVTRELKDLPPTGWAECDIEILTRAQPDESEAAGPRRFGVFFGVSNYLYDAEARQATGGEHGLNLGVSHRDAEVMSALLRDTGGLTDVRAFTNERATRRNLEEAVTRWLPSVSKPGDTVFVFFSGHGGQIPDDNGDEQDQMDEYIVPSDYISPNFLDLLVEKYKAGQLSATEAARVERLVDLYRRSGDAGPEAVVRASGVSDDLFGRWLQKLSGRQVVVMLDTCHSGGFASREKGLADGAARKAAFDFLDGELVRMKDIGAQDQAMLAAAMAPEVAYERNQQDMGVLSFYIVEGINASQGPFRLEQAHQHAQARMATYFQELNAARAQEGNEPITPSHPHLVNFCRNPVFLKP